MYSETLNSEYIESIHQMANSSLSDNEILQIFSVLIKWLYETLSNYNSRIFMAIYLFSQILRFTLITIEKNIKTTFDKFFRCMAYLGFNCR